MSRLAAVKKMAPKESLKDMIKKMLKKPTKGQRGALIEVLRKKK